jgi:hypothetical protein
MKSHREIRRERSTGTNKAAYLQDEDQGVAWDKEIDDRSKREAFKFPAKSKSNQGLAPFFLQSMRHADLVVEDSHCCIPQRLPLDHLPLLHVWTNK